MESNDTDATAAEERQEEIEMFRAATAIMAAYISALGERNMGLTERQDLEELSIRIASNLWLRIIN